MGRFDVYRQHFIALLRSTCALRVGRVATTASSLVESWCKAVVCFLALQTADAGPAFSGLQKHVF